MAWVESHQSLRDHPKLYQLMELLSLTKAEAIGHLHMLWWWCIDYAPDGVLRRYSSLQIARAAGWNDDPQIFTAALVQAGLLDDQPLSVHDWTEFCGEVVDKRLARMAAAGRLPLSAAWLPNMAGQTQTPEGLSSTERKESSKEKNDVKDVKDLKAVKDVHLSDVDVLLPVDVNTHSSVSIRSTDVGVVERVDENGNYRIPEPKQEPDEALVMRFKVLKGVPYEHVGWDRKWRAHYLPIAQELLRDCGSYQAAYACLEHFSKQFTEKGFRNWTLKAIADRAAEWLGAQKGKEHGPSNSERFFAALRKQRSVGETGPGLRATSGAGTLLSAVRDHAAAGDGDVQDAGPGGNPSDDGSVRSVQGAALEESADRE